MSQQVARASYIAGLQDKQQKTQACFFVCTDLGLLMLTGHHYLLVVWSLPLLKLELPRLSLGIVTSREVSQLAPPSPLSTLGDRNIKARQLKV